MLARVVNPTGLSTLALVYSVSLLSVQNKEKKKLLCERFWAQVYRALLACYQKTS
jgi:hypothetical protein